MFRITKKMQKEELIKFTFKHVFFIANLITNYFPLNFKHRNQNMPWEEVLSDPYQALVKVCS